MAKKPRFGILLLQVLPIQAIIEQCQFVEALGYDSVWIGDQFYNPIRTHNPMWEAWTLLAALAAKTTRIRIGTLVTNFIYRNPALVASQALSVDHLSSGRLELGLGAGFNPVDHRMTGSEVWSPRERMSRFQEAVQIVDRMLRNEVTTFEGQYYRVKDAVLSPRPVQKPRPPLTLGVTGPAGMKFAATTADCWNTLDMSTKEYAAGAQLSAKLALEACRKRQETFYEYCASAGRKPGAIRHSLLVGYAANTPTDSIDHFHEYVGRYQEAGIDEFVFFWVPDEYREVLANRISGFTRTMVEKVATQAFPSWRKQEIQ